MKDWLLSKALQAFLRERLSRYGELKSLSVDSRERSIDLIVRPHGEPGDVRVKVTRYSVHKHEGKCLLTIEESTASRTWVARLLEDYLHGRSFEIPPIAAAVL